MRVSCPLETPPAVDQPSRGHRIGRESPTKGSDGVATVAAVYRLVPAGGTRGLWPGTKRAHARHQALQVSHLILSMVIDRPHVTDKPAATAAGLSGPPQQKHRGGSPSSNQGSTIPRPRPMPSMPSPPPPLAQPAQLPLHLPPAHVQVGDVVVDIVDLSGGGVGVVRGQRPGRTRGKQGTLSGARPTHPQSPTHRVPSPFKTQLTARKPFPVRSASRRMATSSSMSPRLASSASTWAWRCGGGGDGGGSVCVRGLFGVW